MCVPQATTQAMIADTSLPRQKRGMAAAVQVFSGLTTSLASLNPNAKPGATTAMFGTPKK